MNLRDCGGDMVSHLQVALSVHTKRGNGAESSLAHARLVVSKAAKKEVQQLRVRPIKLIATVTAAVSLLILILAFVASASSGLDERGRVHISVQNGTNLCCRLVLGTQAHEQRWEASLNRVCGRGAHA